jgi:hypothetical protein
MILFGGRPVRTCRTEAQKQTHDPIATHAPTLSPEAKLDSASVK